MTHLSINNRYGYPIITRPGISVKKRIGNRRKWREEDLERGSLIRYISLSLLYTIQLFTFPDDNTLCITQLQQSGIHFLGNELASSKPGSLHRRELLRDDQEEERSHCLV